MRIQQFQVSLVDKTRKQLPRALRNFEPRSFFSIVKIFYRNPRLHYEVWVRGQERLIEIGLHFEADKSTNDSLLAYFDSRSIEIHAELGPEIEIEQWTNSWSRVHRVLPYTNLDAELVDRVAEQLARMVTVLQPMLAESSSSPSSLKVPRSTSKKSSTAKPSSRSRRTAK